jgi:Cu(I)/Ag(I) efflux system membrane protein CusA/SilA
MGILDRSIRFFLERKLLTAAVVLLAVGFGVGYAPFDWELAGIPRDPVPVDAIPDIGENQQIVFTEWPGRSPQDVQDQITYPLTTALLGVGGVKSVRATSMFGFSSVYVIFEEDVDFYWARTRILEKLASLPSGLLPPGVEPRLGPEATALGQIFWYTLEGRDGEGRPAGGWDLQELRSVQDWHVRYALMSVTGVAEVASVGGFVREYQVDVDPDAMRAYRVTLEDIFRAVRESNVDVGARTIEVNRVEYVVRGLGFIRGVEDLENAVVRVRENVPVYLKSVARVTTGPALRRGALDKEGAEAVGGVVVVRYGENPLAVINRVKEKIGEIAPGLPVKDLPDGRASRVTIVPFYDRTDLIYETLGTLNRALVEEILITVIVIVVMVMHLRSSLLISGILPLAVLGTFIAMKLFRVDANIVALSGIAIAIGTIVDMGIVMSENILKKLQSASPGENSLETVARASSEVGSAVLTAILTTVVGFLPVFMMTGKEGKLFRPLAFTKTFALLASVLIALFILPALAHLLMGEKRNRTSTPGRRRYAVNGALVVAVGVLLAHHWMPLGIERGVVASILFVALAIGLLLGLFRLYQRYYASILGWCLDHKAAFLVLPVAMVVLGGAAWSSLGREFIPTLDEGSFLFMPTTSVHASIGEATDVLSKQDAAIKAIPEVDTVVGKVGRVESSLDPAPVSMVETVVTYIPEYGKDAQGRRVRQWRPHIRTPDDIWDEIERAARIPGTTGASAYGPIAIRLVMLQTGMTSPIGIKVFGRRLEDIEAAGVAMERLLKTGELDAVRPVTVRADRIVGKPYLEIVWDREELARYGISVARAQRVVEVAVGGMPLTTSVEGTERYPVRVRYMRELRDSIESLEEILVSASDGTQVPLGQLADVEYRRGPMAIKSEESLYVGYLTFSKREDLAEVDAVEAVRGFLASKEKSGALTLPAGVHYRFAGTYEHEIHSRKTLMVVLPLALVVIFTILYLHFRAVSTAMLVFSGVFVAWAGGFIMLWFYGTNLSVAVWVGFLALFGIASDDGVVIATYLKQSFADRRPDTVAGIRAAALEAGMRRIRPCLMTSATTLLALLPVLTSTGRGAEIMVPMAIPSFGGMLVAVITTVVVPVLYSAVEELRLRLRGRTVEN